MDLLVERKVLDNWLGRDEAVVNLINKLCHQIVEGNHSCYHDISEWINEHYMGSWSKLTASHKSQHFRDFLRGSITVVRILALFFSFWSFLRPFVSLRRTSVVPCVFVVDLWSVWIEGEGEGERVE